MDDMNPFDGDDSEISYDETMEIMEQAREMFCGAGRLIFLGTNSRTMEGKINFHFGLAEDTTFGFTFD